MQSVLRTEVWKYLPIKTIKHLSLCGKTTRCDLQKIWQHVLKRDFHESVFVPQGVVRVARAQDNAPATPGADEVAAAQDMYLRYNHIVKYFTSFIPMITETTIRIIDKFVLFDEWDQIKRGYNEYMQKPKVLNVHLLLEIFSSMLGEVMADSDQDDEYWEEREENGDDERETELEDLINNIEKYLLDKYSVKRVNSRRGFGKSPDYRNLELVLTPIYVESNVYMPNKRIVFNLDQDYLFTIVEFGTKELWCSHLSREDFEGANRIKVLSELDM